MICLMHALEFNNHNKYSTVHPLRVHISSDLYFQNSSEEPLNPSQTLIIDTGERECVCVQW